MGKRITNADGLPDWFGPNRYAEAIHLDARGWLKQLHFRELCHDIVSYSSPEELVSSEPYGFKIVEFLSAVRANPIFDDDDSQYEQLIDGIGGCDLPIDLQSNYPPGLFGITAYDIGDIILEWDCERQKDFMRWLEYRRVQGAKQKNRGFPRPRVSGLFEPLETDHIKPIRIAAMFPDDVLRKSFELFVSKEQEKLDPLFIGKAKRSNTFLEWCNCGLLQYLDLVIWSIQESTSITNKALVQGIFPINYEKGEENIRSTTKKHAAIILGPRPEPGMSMSTLWAYARLEDFLESQESK